MKRLIENTVFSGFITACRLATVPTRRSPLSLNATTDGGVRPPSAFSRTVGSPPSRTATHELVVPRSIPMVFAMLVSPVSLLRCACPKNLSGSMADVVLTHRGAGRAGALAPLTGHTAQGPPLAPAHRPEQARH